MGRESEVIEFTTSTNNFGIQLLSFCQLLKTLDFLHKFEMRLPITPTPYTNLAGEGGVVWTGDGTLEGHEGDYPVL